MSQRKSGSQGRRSAKDLMSTHRTTGEPVLPTAESQQLVAMTPLLAPDFVVQNEFWLQGGIPDAEHSSVKFSVLDEVETVDQMRAVFHGASPNLLLVDQVDGENFPVFVEYLNKITKLLTTLGRLDIVLFSKATAVDSAQFLMAAMKLKDKLPYLPVRIGECDRLVGSVAKSESYDVWVATSTHRSRMEAASVYYKMINMRLPGEGTDGVLFADPDITYPMLIIQYAFSWEDELMQFLGLDKSEATICPGIDTAFSRYLYLETDFATAKKVIETFGRYPRFALLPLKWYTGEQVNSAEYRVEVTMAKDFQARHLKYFYSYVMATFWDLGDLLGGKHFSAQIMHSKRIRLGLSKRGYEFAKEKMAGWLQDLGLELRDEQSGKQLSGSSAATMTQASETPEAWGPCESVFLTNVPPYWRDSVLRQVLLTQGTSQENFVLDKCRFHVGDIRSKTWMLTGPKASALVGKVLQAAQAGTLIVPISRQEYMSRKSTIQSRGGKGGGKGASKGSSVSERQAEPMEVNDSDVGALKMFKRKRDDS